MVAERIYYQENNIPSEEVLEAQRKALAEVDKETRTHHPLEQCRYVCFLSRSNGRGRPKRRYPREVELVSSQKTRALYHAVNRGDPSRNGLDSLAIEILGNKTTPEEFINQLRKYYRK